MMNRSHWGWGYLEKAPPLAEVAPRATAFFGELDAQAPRPMDAVVLTPPRVEVPAALKDIASQQAEPRKSFHLRTSLF